MRTQRTPHKMNIFSFCMLLQQHWCAAQTKALRSFMLNNITVFVQAQRQQQVKVTSRSAVSSRSVSAAVNGRVYPLISYRNKSHINSRSTIRCRRCRVFRIINRAWVFCFVRHGATHTRLSSSGIGSVRFLCGWELFFVRRENWKLITAARQVNYLKLCARASRKD